MVNDVKIKPEASKIIIEIELNNCWLCKTEVVKNLDSGKNAIVIHGGMDGRQAHIEFYNSEKLFKMLIEKQGELI